MIITWMTSPNWKKGERKFSLILSNMSKNFENFDFHPYGKHWKNVKYVLNPYPAKLIWTCQIFKKWINIVERGKKKSKTGSSGEEASFFRCERQACPSISPCSIHSPLYPGSNPRHQNARKWLNHCTVATKLRCQAIFFYLNCISPSVKLNKQSVVHFQ